MNKLTTGHWTDYIFNLNNSTSLDKASLELATTNFWTMIKTYNWSNKVLQVFVVIEYEGEVFKSLGKAVQLNFDDFLKFKTNLVSFLNLKDDFYHTVDAHNIIFRFKFVESKDLESTETVIHEAKAEFDLDLTPAAQSTEFKGYDLPNSMNLFSWGKILESSANKVILEYISRGSAYIFNIKMSGDSHHVSVSAGGETLISFKDTRSGSDNNSFTRTINNHEFVYRDGVMVIKYETKKVSFISPVDTCKDFLDKMITFDIETRVLDSKVTPYCICYHDGAISRSFYLSYFDSVEAMLLTALSEILSPKYNGYTVYAHNLSKFDGVLILKTLVNMTGLRFNFTKNDSNFINIQIRNKKGVAKEEKFVINIRDSYLLLPSSLRALSQSFGVISKSFFPFTFFNEGLNPLNYKGSRPGFSYYEESGITRKDYDTLLSSQAEGFIWNAEAEAREYCIRDCIALWQVLNNFNTLIWTYFGINAIRYPTIPSLAFAIFRSHYMAHDIPVLIGPMYDFIKASYTGGSVDVYNPNPKGYFTVLASKLKNLLIWAYDVNSLYPAVMLNSLMPVGTPRYFKVTEGVDFFSLFKEDKDRPLGFFKVEVTAPDNLHIPILQTRLKTLDGYRTVSPVGCWTGIYFSGELYNAIKNFGYSIKVLEGYTFEGQHIFKDYVEHFYAIKKSAPKTDPMYYIAKLFMNSLYGRFGMAYEQVDTRLMSSKQLSKLISGGKLIASDILNLSSEDTDINLVSVFNKLKYEEMNKAGMDLSGNINVSISIASAITAEARVLMSSFKNIPGINIFYSDTDSAYVDQPLPAHLVGNELGQFKLEGTFRDIFFLAPKMYVGTTTDGEEVLKVKGVTAQGIKDNNINFETLKQLLFKDKELVINQLKSFRSLSESSIKIVDQTYTMVATENKRELVYDCNGVLVNTRPIRLPRPPMGTVSDEKQSK